MAAGPAAIAPLKQKVESLAMAETEQDRFETVLPGRTSSSPTSPTASGCRRPSTCRGGRWIRNWTWSACAVMARSATTMIFPAPSPTVLGGRWRAPTRITRWRRWRCYKLAIQALRQGKSEEAVDHLRQALRLVEQRRATAGFAARGLVRRADAVAGRRGRVARRRDRGRRTAGPAVARDWSRPTARTRDTGRCRWRC